MGSHVLVCLFDRRPFMTRRSIILAALVLLLTTFVIAVQHDTFVRRWCLPAAPPATRPTGPLDQVIDEFEIDEARGMETVLELERRSGLRIRFNEPGVEYLALRAQGSRTRYVIRRATVEQLLGRIFDSTGAIWALEDPLVVDADGSITLDNPKRRRKSPTMLRVHDASGSLLQPNAAIDDGDLMSAAELLQHVRASTLHIHETGFGLDPVLLFGDKLIVLTTARTHWQIDQRLREDVEARHVNRNQPTATLPAK